MAAPTADASIVDAVVEPVPENCGKKDLLVPRCVVSIERGISYMCTLNCSSQSIVLPEGMKLAKYESNERVSVAVLCRDEDVPVEIIAPNCKLLQHGK